MKNRMFRSLNCCLFVVILSSCSKPHEIKVNGVIPQPNMMEISKGSFSLNDATQVVVTDDKLRTTADVFAAEFKLNIIEDFRKIEPNTISLHLNEALDVEEYQLTISKEGIEIQASGEAGAFYALQTLKQLQVGLSFPVVSISDAPRFEYRGMMLDVARYFYPVEDVKKFIDLMALHKYNKFHWHLTDDQGWRIEIKQYPLLTEVGSVRSETMRGDFRDSNARKVLWEAQEKWDFRKQYSKNPKDYDGKPHSGFYTQEQIKEIIQYADERYIEVIPEIDVPGHASAALAAYPEFGCKEQEYQVSGRWSIHPNILCPSEETFTFLENVFTEVMALFPSQYVHVGGDEANKAHWQDCDMCQQMIKELDLGDEMGLQSYFIGRLDKFLTSKGKKLVGWDEILEGGLSPNATVMSWRGEEGGIEAANHHHNVIMAPGNYTYFDKYQTQAEWDTKTPLAQWGLVTLETAYNYNPIPKNLPVEQHKFILGAQGCMWTEYIPDYEYLEYMALPRMAALSEAVWSKNEHKNWQSFQDRLVDLQSLYKRYGYNFADNLSSNAQ